MNKMIAQLEAVTAIVDLKWNRETKEFSDVFGSPTIIQNEDALFISAEDGKGFADYYRDMYINEQLETIAKQHGGYWEWQNPGAIVFCK